jgi:hypothetical protein
MGHQRGVPLRGLSTSRVIEGTNGGAEVIGAMLLIPP